MNQIVRKHLHSASRVVDFALDELDLDWLRREFVPLLDEAAQAAQLAGLEPDDVVIERSMRCLLTDGREFLAAAECLADRERLLRCIVEAAAETAGEPVSALAIRVVALRVNAIAERWA